MSKFDPAEVETGKGEWSVRTEDGQEVAIVSSQYEMLPYEVTQYDQNGYGVRTKLCTAEDVKSFIEDVRGNWGESNPDVCEAFKQDGSCIHSEHTK